jgi:hypothetical protein
MNNTARWIITLLALLLIIALIALARGDEERGADTTTTISDAVVTTTVSDAVTTTAGS